MSAGAAIQPLYLRLAPADIARVKLLFESYEGVGVVRTVDRAGAIVVVLAVRDFLPVARAVLAELQEQIDCVEIAPPPRPADDWLLGTLDD